MSAVPAERAPSATPPATSPSDPADAALTTQPSATPDEDIASRWPRSFAALQVRNYRVYFCSQIVATTGLWMQRIAQDWLVADLTKSAAAVGITVACQFLPVLLFGMFGGLIADRFPRRKVLMVTQSIAATLAISLGLLAMTGQVQPWHIYMIAIGLGFVTVVDNPTRQAFVSDLVGRRHIRNAVSLNSSVFQLGGLIGPAISGILIGAVGQGPSFLINGGACLLVVTLLSIMVVSDAVPDGGGERRSIRRDFAEGLNYIRRTSEVAWTIALVGVLSLFGLNMPVILTAFATTEFSSGVGGYSLFNTLVAVGSLVGAMASARRTGGPRLRLLVSCMLLLGIALSAAALSGFQWLFCAVLIGVGVCTLLFLTSANSLVQMTAPAAVRGRVMSVYLLMLLGCQALGAPMVGGLIDHLGVRAVLFGCGAIIASAAVAAGLAMARQSHLRLSLNRPQLRTLPVQIVRR